jgi:hypothetical protein
VHLTANLHGYVQHSTGQGEQVAEDSIEPLQLCGTCLDEVSAALGLKIRRSTPDSQLAAVDSSRAHP